MSQRYSVSDRKPETDFTAGIASAIPSSTQTARSRPAASDATAVVGVSDEITSPAPVSAPPSNADHRNAGWTSAFGSNPAREARKTNTTPSASANSTLLMIRPLRS